LCGTVVKIDNMRQSQVKLQKQDYNKKFSRQNYKQ
jgi:hypothetical protein